MEALLVFSITLLAAALVSELAERTVLSTAVLFLLAGFLCGRGVLGIIPIEENSQTVASLARLALFAVLFTDGMRLDLVELRSAWRLPGRALALGMPLTFAATALLARGVAGLPWGESFLVGAVLSPTDPVLASAIVGREEIPYHLRHLLNVESGLNDGLALPVVVALLAVLGHRQVHYPRLVLDVAAGIALGAVLPAVISLFRRVRLFSVSRRHRSLFAIAIGLLLLSLASVLGINSFLAAFVGGISLASAVPEVRDAFREVGENLTELLKLAALLVFGALISPHLLADISLRGYLFALLALVAARPAALGLALLGSRLPWKERAVALWFGPKGFSSVLYGILVLGANLPRSTEMFHLIAIVIGGSIIAHSSTDVPIARWFERAEPEAGSRPGVEGAGDR